MIPGITEIGFGPGTAKAYATLHQATISFAEMGDRTITTQVRIDGDITPDFSGWELTYKGEKFILPIRDPQAAKSNESRNSIIDLTFRSWVVDQLQRYFFVSLSTVATGVEVADKYNAPINLNITNFVTLFNRVLQYYFGNKIQMQLYSSGTYTTEPSLVEIDHTYIWDVLTKIYEVYGQRWVIDYDSTNDIYYIKVGYPAPEISDHDFEYGFSGGLLKFERQVQDDDIRNILLGRGGEKNLPYRYFKDVDPSNPDWTADPDAIPELANINFDRLRDAAFRWYIRGWMRNPNRDTSWDATHIFPTYSTIPEEYQWAYDKGCTDTKFNPVEYAKDDESIAKYGERWGALDDDDNIYPTIQNVSRDPIGRVDEVVSVSEIVTDDIEKAAEAAAVESNITGGRVVTHNFGANETIADKIKSDVFTVPEGSTGNVSYTWMNPRNNAGEERPLILLTTNCSVTVEDTETGNELPISAIPAGSYRLVLRLEARNSSGSGFNYVSYGLNTVKLVTSVADANAWKPTFDIWVKNIWGTTQGEQETDAQYAARVWEPILGDRTGGEAKIVFSDGFMSISQDYEFTLASYPVKDRSKSIGGVASEWKITLYKSDAEFDATGLFIPNTTTGGKPVAGDHFYFIGIDMPFEYVFWGEERIHDNKVEKLGEVGDINPTWLITLDKIRVNTLADGEFGQTLAERLQVGSLISITDSRFTGGNSLTLYIQSINLTWNEPSEGNPYIVPDIEVVLSDKIVSSQSPITKLSNDVSSIRSAYVRAADLDTAIRRVASPLFLKKTGESDSSESPTTFASRVSSADFRQGDIGGAGWGHYTDGDNESVLELDKLVVRQELRVNSLVANQISYEGGKQITSAASIECTQVEETDTGYICYFDQKRGSVANHFQVGDIAMGQMFDPENNEERYYRAAVIAVSDYSITLSKTQKDGQGAPQSGDIIVQYGNLTDASRQYVIIRDVIGGGYERMLSGLNAVNASGLEYYFAGKQNNANPRWFVGNSNGEYAEWADGVLNIKGRISVRKSDGTYQAMDTYIANIASLLSGIQDEIDDTELDVAGLQYLKTALADGSTIVQSGLVLTNLIQLGQTESGVFNVYSGINGLMDTNALGNGIAAWYGGPMTDHEADTSAVSYAKSLFRFDGSGYLASGNIGWDAQGSGHIPGISWQGNNVIISGDVKLASLSGDSVTELLTLVQQLNNWFGEDANGDIYVKRNGVNARNFYSFGGVTAYGVNGSGGGGGGGGVDLERVWQSLTNNTDFPDVKINVAHIPDITMAMVTGLSTALAGKQSAYPFTITGTSGAVYDLSDLSSVEYARDLLDADDLCFVDPEEGEDVEIDDPGVTGTVLWGAESANQVQLDVNGTSKWLLKPNAIAGIESSVGIILGYFVSGSARNAIKLNGHEDTYFATASSLSDLTDTVDGLVTGVSSVAGKSGDVTLAITDITGLPSALNSKLEVAVTSLGAKTGAITLGAGLVISNDNVLSVTGQTMGTVTRVDLGSTQYAPDTNGVVGLPAYPTTLPASDVYAWAKKASLDVADVPGLPWSKITSGTPTTLSGYGITDVSFSSAGVADKIRITLGSNYHDVLTAHQSLEDYATKTYVGQQGFITKAVNDLTNYYLKSETYTQSEVNALIAAINQFHYEIAPTTSDVTDPKSNVLYLIGPIGSGTDKYEEYVYPNATTGWVKIGDTSIDLSGYLLSSVAAQTYQPLDADLTAIAALAGGGLLKRNANNSWTLDTSAYITGITSQMISSALGYTPMDIDDAFIEDGDIHINGQTITPLVAADLTGYANTVQASGTGNYVSAVSKAANSNVITVTYGTLPTVITAARDLDDADDLCFVDPEEGEDVEIDDPGTTGTVLWGSESASQVSLDVNGVSKTLLKAAALDGINSSIGVLLGYFSSGSARNALALGGHGADYFATASGLSELETEVSGLVTGVSSVVGQEGDVTVTQIATALTSAGYKLTDTIYTLPTATSSALGGIKIGYSESGKNYAVQLSDGKAYVNVPWTDTVYTLPIAGASTLGGIKIGTGLSIDGSGVVSVTGQTQGTVTRVDVGSAQYSPDLNGVVGLPAYPTTLPASDVYDWAKAATKPSYTFSEIGSKPDTLAGYGITDAKFSSAGVSDKIRITLGTNYHDVLTAHQSLSNYYDKTETNSLISEAIEDLGLGDAATYGVGSVASGDNGLVTGGQVWSAISTIPTGTVTSVDLSVPTGLSVSGGPITSSGTLAISLATGYSIPLTADTNKGVTAYGWGDHSLAGYFAAADFTPENIQLTLGIEDWALAATKPSYTKSEVGLGNVTNDAQVKRTEMGAASGVATLGSDGKIPSSQLPSYVDDVLEYASLSAFPATGESGKIYVALDTNKTYRWSGTTYTEISPSVVIGTTTGTAFDGGSGYSHVTNDDIHVTASQKTAWTAKYDKPSGGIPKSDLASAVQTSLGLADTAFQTSSFTKANIQSTLGISNWALEANKPSYTFSEIGSTPTSIDGYGIDDAYIEDHDIHLGDGSITVLAADTVYNLVVKNSAGTTVLTYNPANVSGGELTLTKAMVGLGSVENTALSSWAGTQNINTLGTITTGVWHGGLIDNAYLALDMAWEYAGRSATHDDTDYIVVN